MAAVPKGSLVLVSGANGFIATYVVDALLQHGYKVRGTVRSAAKGEWLDKLFSAKYGADAYTSFVVPDVTVAHAFDGAVKGVAAVAHVASPVNFEPDPKNIEIAVANVKNMLASAANEASITRFVLTSSSSSALIPKTNTKHQVNASTWNDEAVTFAQTPPFEGVEKGFATYAASKTLAEKALWEFARESKPHFTVNAVLPNFTMGTVMHPEQFGSTAGLVRGLWGGDDFATKVLHDVIIPQYYVHVRDIALLHVGAIALDEVRGERIFGFAGPFNFNALLDGMKKIDPEHKLPPRIEGLGDDLSVVDTASAVSVLKGIAGRSHFLSFEEGLKDCVKPSPA